MTGERLRIWAGFIVVSTVWGSTWLVIKIGLETAPPFLSCGLRFVIASLILLAIVRVRKLPIPRFEAAKRVYLSMGIFSFGIPFALVYWGEQFIPSALGSILFATFPFWVALFSHFFLRAEPIDRYKAAGIVLGFAGIVLVFWGDINLANPLAGISMAGIVLATILQAYVLIVVKKHAQTISPFVMNLLGMSIGALCLLLLSVLTESWGSIRWTVSGVASIIYLAIFGSVVAFVTYYWLLKRVQVLYLSFTSFINPIIAVILGAVVLGETLRPSAAVGASAVLLGILVANGKSFYGKIA